MANAETKRTFEAEVRPILQSHCFHCHGEEAKTEGRLDVRLVRLLVAGGESGPAVVAGKAGESYLIERLESGEMPPGEKKVSAEELRVVREWINQGARTARPEPANADQLAFTNEERAFWSFQPVVAPPVPKVKAADRVRTPVDAFVLRRLEQVSSFNGKPKATASEASRRNTDAFGLPLNEPLSFSLDADKRTLIRRAYFDLLGLPPSPEDVDAFLADDDPQAWSHLLDRLLDSDHYGERWARHWLAGKKDDQRTFVEPFVLVRKNGDMIAMYRTSGVLGRYVYQNESTDGGKTWTEPHNTELYGFPSFLMELKDGRILWLGGYRRKPYGLRAVLSRDGGKTWDAKSEIVFRDDGGTSDLGYPSAVEFEDGRVLVIYWFNQEKEGDLESETRYLAGTFFKP